MAEGFDDEQACDSFDGPAWPPTWDASAMRVEADEQLYGALDIQRARVDVGIKS